jgi:nucleoside-diphosphate-sugar epimerase
MKIDKHLVLGASGSVGSAVVAELQSRKLLVEAVERSKDVPGLKTIKADLLDHSSAKNAIDGAAFVYLCVGLPYEAKYWEENWPKLMKNVVDACIATGAKLIFLDNIYMYRRLCRCRLTKILCRRQ